MIRVLRWAFQFFLICILQFDLFGQSNCLVGNSRAKIEGENIVAKVLNAGDFLWIRGAGLNPTEDWCGFCWPKDSLKQNLAFAGGLWFGGLDLQNDQIITLAQTYRQGERTYWPGPVLPFPTSYENCRFWDKHFKVTREDMEAFSEAIQFWVPPYPAELIPDRIKFWPGKGNPFLLDSARSHSDSISIFEDLAPFEDKLIDGIGDGIYNPATGDLPALGNRLEMVWWVMNDVGNLKNFSINVSGGSPPGGLEIQCLAHTFPTNNNQKYLANTIFFDFKIKNKGQRNLDSCRVGFFYDGNFMAGQKHLWQSDVTRNMAINYRTGSNTGNSIINWPAVGLKVIKGPQAYASDLADNNRNGYTDESQEEVLLSGMVVYKNTSHPTFGNPQKFSDYFHYLKSQWKNGSAFTYDGSWGQSLEDSAHPACTYLYPGTSDPFGYGVGGSQENPKPMPAWFPDSTQSDIRDIKTVINTGPFPLYSGSEFTYSMVILVGHGGNHLENVESLRRTSDSLDAFLPMINLKQSKPNEPVEGVSVYPNPSKGEYWVKSSEKPDLLFILDSQGKKMKEWHPDGPHFKLILDFLPVGVYQLVIQKPSGVVREKLVRY